jgi:ABC-type Zn uptake system ZnuABC Zn-binding protein ZnuA
MRLVVHLPLALAAAAVIGCGSALAKVRVAASTQDLASIAASVGGDRVEAVAIARANADPHRVEVLPSYMVRVSRADVYLRVGLGLDLWAQAIIDGSRNRRLVIVDCSRDVSVLERPTGKVDASMGDVHPDGNPHYWLDPRNGVLVARTIAAALSRVDPEGAAAYASGAESFAARADLVFERGRQAFASGTSRDLLTYHRSWSYFASAFDLEVVSTIEPVPGIPPTARHLQDLVELVRERRIPVAIIEPYFSADAGEFLGRETGIRVLRESASCDGPEAGSYLAHFERLFAAIAAGPASRGGD